jgi:hypothetical protein
MTLKTHALALSATLALAACTTPADVSKPIGAGKGNDAKVVVSDTPAGFNVDVKYSRYQMIPETSAVLTVCRSTAIARVAEEAKSRGRKVEPLAEQNVRVSSGRNGILGLTSCRAFAEATWKR